ncbi:hypothetical protein NM208_g1568 [Fusarium decemcellulare]|uniref:Uncharacterized protein n=1 Tax=Fusarium decemcellulare TaxID=57161 RepID=A0ACC1SVY7_9HYPO|nr:hypothetical protein NM208_g1568 [Fusarium decemcellulare]
MRYYATGTAPKTIANPTSGRGLVSLSAPVSPAWLVPWLIDGLFRSEGKIEELDERLARMSRLLDTLVAGDSANPMTSASANSSPASAMVTPGGNETPLAGPSPVQTSTPRSIPQQRERGENTCEASNRGQEECGVKGGGSSSLSAHSTFAVDFLHRIAGQDAASGNYFDTRELLDALGHVVDKLQNQQESLESVSRATKEAVPVALQRDTLPPIEETMAMVVGAQAKQPLMLAFFRRLLHPQTLPSLCLKVYFSPTYSESDFIILNIALYFVYCHQSIPSSGQADEDNSWDKYQLQCAANAEKALAALSLHINPTYDMVLALVFGAIYFVETLKPSLAWTFVTTAQQTSLRLGFHTQEHGADEGSEIPNRNGLLFWVIYFLEKSLSLRLGRSSTIPPHDITVPYPGGDDLSPSWMSYGRLQVNQATLAGAVYDGLYCAQALRLTDDARRQRVADLSQQLHGIWEEARALLERETDQDRRDLLTLLWSSDNVTYLSVSTLIHRAVPCQTNSATIFTDDCIASARAALEAHDKCTQMLDKGRPLLLSTYLSWTILFLPFVPFIVLFCYVVETGNTEDLARMSTFVESIASASQYSPTLADHHHLFEVFHNVAQRYTELKSALAASTQNEIDINAEMDAYINSIWFQTHASTGFNQHMWNTGAQSHMMPAITFPTTLLGDLATDARSASGRSTWSFTETREQ